MSEETLKDPRDLNGDGKVTLGEKIQHAAEVAGKKMGEVADEMVVNAKDLYAKAAPKAKEVLGEVKENASGLMDKARCEMDKAKDKIDTLKQKKDKQA